MNTKEKKLLYEQIMLGVAKILKKKINEISENLNNDLNNHQVVNFLMNVFAQSPKTIEKTKRDNLKSINIKINEDEHIDAAKDYILSHKSVLGEVNFDKLITTIETLEQNVNKNITELMLIIINNCIAEIQEHYHMGLWQFALIKNIDEVEYIDFVVPKELAEPLIDDLKKLGLIGRELKDNIIQFKQDFKNEFSQEALDSLNGWTYVRFVTISQKDCRDIIRKLYPYVYHITDLSNVDNIMNNGIHVSNLSHPNVPDRVFLIVPSRDDISDIIGEYPSFDINNYINDLAAKILSYRIKDGLEVSNKWEYGIIEIDIDKLPSDMKFYWDLHSFPYAFFVNQNIPSESINGYEIGELSHFDVVRAKMEANNQ